MQEGKELQWTCEFCLLDSRKKDNAVIYRMHEGEISRGDYRVFWIHSSAKQRQDKNRRESKISKSEQALEKLSASLRKYRLKTPASIEKEMEKVCKGVGNLIQVKLIESKTFIENKFGRGRPGSQAQYEAQEVITYELEWHRDEEAINKAARTDGLFPMVDHTELDASDVLLAYKNQPYLEKRFSTKKSVLNMAPVFLKQPRRIEAMMFLYFIFYLFI